MVVVVVVVVLVDVLLLALVSVGAVVSVVGSGATIAFVAG